MRLLLIFLLLNFSCQVSAPNTVVYTDFIPQIKTNEIGILNLINSHRESIGLKTLDTLGIIRGQAYKHTQYMVLNGEVSHLFFYERSAYLKSATGASKVTENVAYGYSSNESLVLAWLKSDSHRKNLEGDFTNFDISAEQDSNGKWYYTNIFINK